jgi:hypothetical protein
MNLISLLVFGVAQFSLQSAVNPALAQGTTAVSQLAKSTTGVSKELFK